MATAWTENLVTASVTVLALVLLAVSLRAWRHTRSTKVLLLALGFGLFAAKGVVLSLGLFLTEGWQSAYLVPSLLLDLAALALFYLAVLRRSGP